MDTMVGLLQMFSYSKFDPSLIFFSNTINNSTMPFNVPKHYSWQTETFNTVSRHMAATSLVKCQEPFAGSGADQVFVEFRIACHEGF